MGAGLPLPQEEAKEIMRATKFRKEDVRRWYKKFMRDYPTGQMEKENFHAVFGKVYKSGPMSDRIFAKLDRNRDGSISFGELMVALSVTMLGTEKEKMEWAFEIFDEDGNGQISLEELSELLKGIDDSSPGTHGEVADTDEVRRKRIASIFKLVDTDSSGFLSRDEFMEGMRSHPTFSKLLSIAPTSKKSDARVRRHADCPRSESCSERDKWRCKLTCKHDV